MSEELPGGRTAAQGHGAQISGPAPNLHTGSVRSFIALPHWTKQLAPKPKETAQWIVFQLLDRAL